jgi:peptidoglycan lytic transglycosylase G
VPWRHSIAAPQRQQLSVSPIGQRSVGVEADGYRVGVRTGVAVLLAALVAATAAPAADVQLKIIFPEGWTVRMMADQVSAVRQIAIHKRHVTPVLTGTKYATVAATVSRPLGFPRGRSIEGFLFPAGYLFQPSTTPLELIRMQLAAFESNWSEVDLGPRKPYDVLRVASMVEREAVVPTERKLISAVIWNRLAKGMPLGIDATLRYGLGIQGTRPITAEELKNQTPYNTSIHKGLPPTPIGNPGLPSMQAAAHPADVDYLYYVRKPDKEHHFFTDSEQEFCQKAAEYGYHC